MTGTKARVKVQKLAFETKALEKEDDSRPDMAIKGRG